MRPPRLTRPFYFALLALAVVVSASPVIRILSGAASARAVASDKPAHETLAGQLIISEFRFSGPGGANDEYIEIYNDGNGNHVVTASSGTGYGVAASDGTTVCTIPNGTVIPPGGHFLCINSVGYTLGSYPAGAGTTAVGDQTYTNNIPDNAGIAIFNNNSGGASYSLANRFDAVGHTSVANTLYREGAGLPDEDGSSIEKFYARKEQSGPPLDTDNNANDFVGGDTDGQTFAPGIQRLGASGPQNTSSPVEHDEGISASVLDASADATATPNTVRSPSMVTNGNFGTLEIRRTFTNNTGSPITRLRFRVVDITTFPPPAGVADLRVLNSGDTVVNTSNGPQIINGTTVEEPPVQPNGGGLNTSVTVNAVSPGNPLMAGSSINLRFLLGVMQTGTYNFQTDITDGGGAGHTEASTLVVNSDNDANDGACDVTHCSLREAINASNASVGAPDTIAFNIPGAGVHTIAPNSALPDITDPVTIDGYTQPGSNTNDAPSGTNATLQIELDGSSAGSVVGLNITAGNTTVRGLVINRFGSLGIALSTQGGNTVEGCFIGTNAAGTADLGNGQSGVLISNVAGNTVGGAGGAARNIISGNTDHGVIIIGASATGNLVHGNLIGTDAAGNADLGNGLAGVNFINAASNMVGDGTASAANIISGNGTAGVGITGGGLNSVQGNRIGTNAAGAVALPNDYGVFVNNSNGNVVGSNIEDAVNLIGGNMQDGVAVTGTGTGNQILKNRFIANGALGIDLGDDGPDTNDTGDPDTGANNRQNFPLLTAASHSPDGLTLDVTGTLNSTFATNFNIDFFSDTACDPSGRGEARTYLGTLAVMTDGEGNTPIAASLNTVPAIGEVVTATATDAAGNTSEFSPCVTVTQPPTATWTGAVNNEWHTGGNWDTGTVPDATQAVIIPSAGVTNEPVISAEEALAASVSVEAGRTLSISNNQLLNTPTLTIAAGAVLRVPANQTGRTNAALTLDGDLSGGNFAAIFAFDGPSLTNNGTINIATFRFTAASQTLAGTGDFTDNLTEIVNGSTVTLASNHIVGNLTITDGIFDQGASFNLRVGDINISGLGTLRNVGTGDLTLEGSVSNAGTVTLNGGVPACGDADSILVRSSVAGDQRAWSGAGLFQLTDVDVQDQAGTAAINVLSGTDSGNNGANWSFSNCPVVATLGNYANTMVQLGANTTITPDAAPTGTASINVATSTNFKGTLEGNPTTGVVRVTDAHPAGTYTVTVTAFAGGGATTTKTFTLTVTTPATCNPVSFAAAANFATSTGPRSVAVGDFNGDGKQDLATANQGGDNVSVLLGNGAGSFGAPASFGIGTQPFSIAVGDFNGDGRQDLAVANLTSANLSVLLGDGVGGFAAATNFATGNNPNSVAVGDFNGDGRQDLAVAIQGASNVSILLGDGAGGFGGPTVFGVGSATPSPLAVGDFNGDGDQDLAVTNQSANSVSILLGDGAGGFGAATNFAAGNGPGPVVIGNFNGDGNQDIAVANPGTDVVSILLGDGAGGFGAATNFAAGNGPNSVAAGDFNGDGNQDIAATNLDSDDVSVLLGDGAGGFGAATNFAAGNGPIAVAVGDFNGDGKQDLASNNFFSSNVSVLSRQCVATTLFVTNTNDSGAGSLRQAILDSNSTIGAQDTIAFNIPGAGVHTIAPTSALPAVTDPVTIDGYTQPGSSANTRAVGNDAVILIRLDGTNAGPLSNGLLISAGDTTVRGLAIGDFGPGGATGGAGVQFAGGSGNVLEGCFVGLTPAGVAAANDSDGVLVNGSNNNRVGGTTPAQRNAIGGNNLSGVFVAGGSTGNLIQGNYIGTSPAGTSAVPNVTGGVLIDASSGNTVGGTAAGAGNLIGGNNGNGVTINGGSTNVVQGNFIGTQADGTAQLPNATHGVVVVGSNNLIGGAAAGAANRIFFHPDTGVGVFNGTGNRISANSIGSNLNRGIDLGVDGTTPNDPGDADVGANDLQNFPVLSSAVSSGGMTVVQGTLNSAINTTFRVEFFSSASCDLAGNGEGEVFVSATDVSTDGNGGAVINTQLASFVAVGQVITATATDPAGNTSEFSVCRTVTATPPTFSVSGRVTNPSNQPILGVNLTLSGTSSAETTTNAAGDYTFAGLAQGGNFTVTPSETGYTFAPASRIVNNLQADQTGQDFTGTRTSHSITGTITDGMGNAVEGVAVVLSGSASALTFTDALGNFTFANLPTGGTFTVTPDRAGFVFTPATQTFTNLGGNATFDSAAAQPSPSPTPFDPSDPFEPGDVINLDKWRIGILTNPTPTPTPTSTPTPDPPNAFDPLVQVFQGPVEGHPELGGVLHIQPRADANGLSYSGLVSTRTIDLNATPIVSVEAVRPAQGDNTQTIFSLGTDNNNWFRFVVEDTDTPASPPKQSAFAPAVPARPAAACPTPTPGASGQQLLFQFSLGGGKFSVGLGLDPEQHRFWRFRYDPPASNDAPTGLVIFETSPDASSWCKQFSAPIGRGQTTLIAELSAGTFGPSANPLEALFDNFVVASTPRIEFAAEADSVNERAGTALITVTRNSAESRASVEYATSNGTACAASDGVTCEPPPGDYTHTNGSLVFEVGETSKTFSVPINNDTLIEGAETFFVTLLNPLGGGLGPASRLTITIFDDETTDNPIDQTNVFVSQHYVDFLGRPADPEGLKFWVRNIDQCLPDAVCREVMRIDTSAAFFLSIEFQQTGFFVLRAYEAAFDRPPTFEGEYRPDLATVREGVVVGQPGALDRIEANKRLYAAQFVARPAFRQRYDHLNEMQYVDALFANAAVVPTEEERTALIVGLLINRETRASVLLKVVEHAQFIEREFNPAFVRMQYFGYLRRDPDPGGFNFWLAKLNAFGGDFRRAEMVKAFLSSVEYRERFGQP